MLKEVVRARILDGCRVCLRFEDGMAGELDFGNLIEFDGVFSKLRDSSKFAKLRVDPEAGTIVSSNRADLDPAVLYASVSGEPIGTTTGNGFSVSGQTKTGKEPS